MHRENVFRGACLLLAAMALSALPLHAGESPLDLRIVWQDGAPSLQCQAPTGSVVLVERSETLVDWTESVRVLGTLHPYPDFSGAAFGSRFYRARSGPAQAEDDWSNQALPDSGLLFKPGSGGGLAAMPSLKWSLLLAQPDRVYFQDSSKYPYHIQFARARLPGYAGMSTLNYYAQALYANSAQRMVLGSVYRAPDPQVRELAVEVTGAEAFPAASAAAWVEHVQRRLVIPPGWRIFYMPSVEQRQETEANLPLFAARGIAVSSLARWVNANTCYSPGWALGRLVYVPATEIQAALVDGRLNLGDILVTDRVPAELPVLAGYLCLEPATPNSHVALLARSLLLPFAYPNSAGLQSEILSLAGREVLLVVEETNGVCKIALQDTTGLLTPERRREILESKQGGPLEIIPKAGRGAYTMSVEDVTPLDTQYIGGKAAHFGFLRRSLPTESPHPALAITFDLWDAFMAQPFGGESLKKFVESRLSRHTYPPNIALLRADLAEIKNAITLSCDFTPDQRAQIIAALRTSGLQGAKVRFRSSTNVEDSESFSGAGLYDSYSGCLEDDTDADDAGPSICDPAEPRERGVFRALKLVYASFYNENAVLERLRHRVNENEVGMAVLVHFSVPDPTEMANGVATFVVEKAAGSRHVTAQIVSQLGAVSVTNPDLAVRPERMVAVFEGQEAGSAVLSLLERSSLTSGGDPVMTWEADYRTLLRQLNTATLAYEAYYPSQSSFELDFEFKRVTPGQVGLKQMRAVPRPVPVPPPSIP